MYVAGYQGCKLVHKSFDMQTTVKKESWKMERWNEKTNPHAEKKSGKEMGKPGAWINCKHGYHKKETA